MKGSDVTTYFSTFIEFKLSLTAMTGIGWLVGWLFWV